MTQARHSYTVHVRVVAKGPDVPWGDVAIAVEQVLLDAAPVGPGPLRPRFEIVEAEVDTAEDLR